MKLTSIQKRAIDEILNHFKDNVKEVQFTSPTGSGKTFMIANVISKIIAQYCKQKVIFVILTLSSAELPKQFTNKLKVYQDYLVNKFNVKYLESPSTAVSKNNKTAKEYSIKFKDKDVLIFGTSSFGKNRIFSEFSIFKDFVNEALNEGYKIIYIRDEAHIGDIKKSDTKSQQDQQYLADHANFIIKMTATPNLKSHCKHVFIYEKELNDENNDCYLLKNKPHFNVGFSSDEIDDKAILDTAIRKFKEIQTKYENEYKKSKDIKYLIRPAMLIQISSKNQDGYNISENDEAINEITKQLDANNLSWAIYLSERKESSLKESQSKKLINLNSISKNDSSIDVIIFKIGPSTGWDIPRACMLVQLRKVCSEKLNQQTIGRIKRNPLSTLKKIDLYMNYWVYSNHQEKTREIHKYVLQKEFKNIKFPSIIALNKHIYESKDKYTEFYLKEFKPLIEKNINDFKSIHEDYFVNNKDKKIKVETIKYKSDDSQTAKYYETLNNFLDVKIYTYNLLNKNKWLNKIDLNDLFYMIQQKIKNITFDRFLFILLNDYINEINIKKSAFFNHESYYEINYENFLPDEYIVYQNSNDIHINFEELEDIYAYKMLLADKEENKNIQYLDSEPESIWLKEIIKAIIDNDVKGKIELIAKNPLQSKIFCEYWNQKESRYAKSYIDFIIKLKDKEQYYYIEIKSKDKDYDEEKTKSIISEFKKYPDLIKNIKFPITVSVALINKNNSSLTKIIDDYNEGITISLYKDEKYKIESIKHLLFEYLKK